jgi:hypothetical protein
MPDPSTIIKAADKIDDFLTSHLDIHEKRIITAVEKLENKILSDTKKLKTREIIDTETIRQTKENLRISQQIHAQLIRNFNNLYGTEIRSIVAEFDDAIGQTQEYFEGFDLPFEFTRFDEDAAAALKNSVIATQAAITEQAQQRIVQNLYNSVYAGLGYEALLEEIKSALTGQTDKRGVSLISHAKRIMHDTYMQFYSTVHKKKADDAELDHFIYYGDVIRDSRPFCAKRAGKMFTTKEIEVWEKQGWQGKAPGSIWVVRGGYNCRHHFVPIDPAWLGDETEIEIARFSQETKSVR